jgi:RNA polymerase sigma-70 factor (ECF subfamily)
MHWSFKPIRSAEFPPDGEAALRPVPGMGTGGLAGGGRVSMVQASGEGLEGRSGGPKNTAAKGKLGGAAGAGASRAADGSSSAKPPVENVLTAQPSGPDGVPEDMATLVLDNPAVGLRERSANSHVPGAWDLARQAAEKADPASDAAVMLRVAQGDESAFNYLVQKYHRAMIHFLFRMVHNQAVAEELAQEVFLRVYRSRESYRAEAKFTTWLYRIATNLAVNHARDTRHERSVQNVYLDAPDEESGTTPDVADDEPTVEQKLVRDERMAAIRSHVMALPERQRMAVLMHKYQGMDYRQIGEVLKLSESATKSLLFRAYQTLRDKLKDFV